MTGSEYWMVWPDNTAVSVLVLLLVAMAFLYAARKPVHHLIGSLGFLISGPLRIGARWLLAAANDMTQRNKAVLLAHGRQEVGQRIEREFERLGAMVTRDLQGYPALQSKLLDGFMPFWRSLDKTMAQVDKKLTGLQDSTAAVDGHMAKYEQINAKTDKAEHALTVSAFTQFAIAFLVMAVASGGAFVNFKLIALPMSEMVGAGDYISSSLRTSEVAALVIIFVEASMGLFLMESLRITHLFPRIANLNEHMRHRMMWIALTLLVTLAGIEAALALMRDMLISDKQALLHSLATVQQAATDSWVARIPTAGQMLLGFILPFALAFIAIPLESLIYSTRTVGGVLLAGFVRTLAFVLRMLGNLARRLSRVLINLYDVVIVLPLLIEHLVKAPRAPAPGKSRRGADAEDLREQSR